MSGLLAGRPMVLRAVGLAYATVGFVATHLIFGILILFLLNWVAWPTIDGSATTGIAASVVIDIGLMALFGLQHTGMARAAVKRASTRLLPEPLERATYVHLANVALLLLVLAWQPVPIPVWSVEAPIVRGAILLVFVLGWTLAAWGSLLIDHLQLLGMRQAWSWFRGEPYAIKPFQRRWLYERVRHPIQLGLIVAFFATPDMTVGHLVFAAGLTVYIVIGTYFEEKDLVATFGDDYAAYRRRVPAFMPRIGRRGSSG